MIWSHSLMDKTLLGYSTLIEIPFYRKSQKKRVGEVSIAEIEYVCSNLTPRVEMGRFIPADV